MRKCNGYQERILMETIDPEVSDHIKLCFECKRVFNLVNSSYDNLSFTLPDQLAEEEINKAFITANRKIKKKFILSLISFVIVATSLLSPLIFLYGEFNIYNILKYFIAISGLMPLCLPVIIVFGKRKVIL